ncbi:hypothetical protein PCASD_13730 [Puccinia coronata f. sp. avenae]|uniref:Uncharacterized protein n=1 Tax=Puccinia coronata f. sp. avenae TaxID=200324 RepID=A0A2N5TB22_9BASI|nr:hypothetical protein PCASD_13730 [Puccinia coronata f. sp. avenae]
MDEPNVTLDIPPKTALFEWQVASPTRSTTKRKNAPASGVSGSPASQVFQPAGENTTNAPGVNTTHARGDDTTDAPGDDTTNAPGDVSTKHTESADVSVFGDPPKRPTGGLPNDTDHFSVSASQTSSIDTRGEEGALPRECHRLTFFCNSGGYLPYILLET